MLQLERDTGYNLPYKNVSAGNVVQIYQNGQNFPAKGCRETLGTPTKTRRGRGEIKKKHKFLRESRSGNFEKFSVNRESVAPRLRAQSSVYNY